MSTWIEHPDLPGRRVEVAEGSVPHHRAAGWVVTEPPPKFRRPKPDEPAAPAKTGFPAHVPAPVDSKTETESPKPRRRTTKEGD